MSNFIAEIVKSKVSGKTVRVEMLELLPGPEGERATGVSMNDELEYDVNDLEVTMLKLEGYSSASVALGAALMGGFGEVLDAKKDVG